MPSYVGDLSKIQQIRKELQGLRGSDNLEAELRSSNWETFEHAFALGQEAACLKCRGFEVELSPSVGKRRADFRVKFDQRWVHFEVKTRALFPAEGVYLDRQDEITKTLTTVLPAELRYLVHVRAPDLKPEQIDLLLSQAPDQIKRATKSPDLMFPVRISFSSDAEPFADLILLGTIRQAWASESTGPFNRGDLITHVVAIPEVEGRKGSFTLGQIEHGHYLLFMGEPDDDFSSYIRKLGELLFGEHNPEMEPFVIYALQWLAEGKHLVQWPPYKPANKIRSLVSDASRQLPSNSPNVLILYTREVILDLHEIENTLQSLLGRDFYRKLSAILVNVEKATGEIVRKLFEHPEPFVKLTATEIEELRLLQTYALPSAD
ncbi:MAG: hypothetical protein FJ026_03220 [Chloroflexi bacterium]|nr:hypothetical protein [Chloroflexota bacterium]